MWTGHQPRFWHAGILAKYQAADAAMTAAGDTTTALHHLVVDQDVQDPLVIDAPVLRADTLTVTSVRLGATRVDVPTGCQPALAIAEPSLPQGIDTRAAQGIRRITQALRSAQNATTLAQQVTGALTALLTPYLSRPLTAHYATDFQHAPWFAAECHRLLHDAKSCVTAYNRAVARDPGAGIAPLQHEPFRCELPLWALTHNAPRQRVYADLADTQPLFTTESGTPLAPGTSLAPRALLLTAWQRQNPNCGLFVHGTGGGRYDRITETWWATWRQKSLAPIAVATADARLHFDVPVHTPRDVTRAIWHAHHLPHNLDRELNLTSPLVQEKHTLLAMLNNTQAPRDTPHKRQLKKERRAAFHRIHAINAELCKQNKNAIQASLSNVTRTRQGVTNATHAHRRDWPFVFNASG